MFEYVWEGDDFNALTNYYVCYYYVCDSLYSMESLNIHCTETVRYSRSLVIQRFWSYDLMVLYKSVIYYTVIIYYAAGLSLTSDQGPVRHCPRSAGHGCCCWQALMSAGRSRSSHCQSSRAICWSGPSWRTHSTVRLRVPWSPHVTEQCCQGPVHHLTTHHCQCSTDQCFILIDKTLR